MRTLILVLTVVLFAAPVWADVTITVTQDATDLQKVWIGYESTEAETIRAFALNLTADHNIVEVNDYAVGDDNNGYGIFPGTFAASITVDATTGLVDNWAVAGYSPVAPADHPDALGGIGTTGVTIEMGSLYDTAAPSQTSGILCSVTMEPDTVGELCAIGNAIRGNVVLESAAEVQALVVGCGPYGGGGCQLPTCHPDYDQWVTVGKPECWCNLKQCYGDATGSEEKIGKKWYPVGYEDLDILVGNWKTQDTSATGPIPEPAICADFDHAAEKIGKKWYRVGYADLGILVGNWKSLTLVDDCLDCP